MIDHGHTNAEDDVHVSLQGYNDCGNHHSNGATPLPAQESAQESEEKGSGGDGENVLLQGISSTQSVVL